MKITNELGLPEPLVDAVRNDGYTKGNADFSVTGLIGPPYQRKLMGEYGEKITEDVSERINFVCTDDFVFWKAAHYVEDAVYGPYVVEKRVSEAFALACALHKSRDVNDAQIRGDE